MLMDIVLLGNAQASLDLAKEAVKRQPDASVAVWLRSRLPCLRAITRSRHA